MRNVTSRQAELNAYRAADRSKPALAARKMLGQALVEFALVLPVLLLLLTATIDFGWMIFNYVSLYNGLREGTRYATVTGYAATPQYYQCDSIRNEIVSRALLSGIQPGDITVTYDLGDPGGTTLGSCPIGSTGSTILANGNRVVVDVDVAVPFLTPFMKTFAPRGLEMHFASARTLFPGGF